MCAKKAFFNDSTMSNFVCENGAHLSAEKGNSSLDYGNVSSEEESMNLQFVVFLLIEQELSFTHMCVTYGFNSIQKTHKGSYHLITGTQQGVADRPTASPL
jgi:hypothetical protein